MSDDENAEMEDVATPSDFLEHIPSKAQRIEVSFQMEPCETEGPCFSRHFNERNIDATSMQQEAAESCSYSPVGFLRSLLIPTFGIQIFNSTLCGTDSGYLPLFYPER